MNCYCQWNASFKYHAWPELIEAIIADLFRGIVQMHYKHKRYHNANLYQTIGLLVRHFIRFFRAVVVERL